MSRPKGALGKKNKKILKEIPILEKTEQELKEIIDKGIVPVETHIELTKEQKERKEKLNTILRDINKNFDKTVIDYGNVIEKRERLSFGYKCLDKLTGGLPRGTYTTIWGSKGTGKTTIAYKAIATTQKVGKIAAYIDMERSYDPIWAKKFGVDTTNLIYVKSHTAEETLDIIITLCREEVADLIVLDSLHGMSPHGEQYEGKAEKEKSVQDDSMALLARKLSQFFRMATPHVSDAKCAVLLIGQSRVDLGSFIKCEVLSGGHALAHNSRLIIRMRRGQKADAPFEKIETEEVDSKGKKVKENKQVGFDCVIHIEKSQIEGCIEGNEIHAPFYYLEGIKE